MGRVIRASLGLVVVFALGCAAGDPQFSPGAPAGFFTGIWHGMISVIALVIGIFADSVHVYEIHNTGGWYDFGFVLGILGVWGGGSTGYYRTARRTRDEREWEELGRKLETKIQGRIRDWADAEPDEDWNVVEAKAQAKLKRRLREWANEP